jgi:hypothetical protein
MALPDDVLQRVYFGNALALLPGLDRTPFPRLGDGDTAAVPPGPVLAQ